MKDKARVGFLGQSLSVAGGLLIREAIHEDYPLRLTAHRKSRMGSLVHVSDYCCGKCKRTRHPATREWKRGRFRLL